jgi:hypothetical protein
VSDDEEEEADPQEEAAAQRAAVNAAELDGAVVEMDTAPSSRPAAQEGALLLSNPSQLRIRCRHSLGTPWTPREELETL